MNCTICNLPIFKHGFAIAMYEGGPVSNDYRGEWGGFECCEQCYNAHQRWQHDPEAVRDWLRSVRNPTQPMNAS